MHHTLPSLCVCYSFFLIFFNIALIRKVFLFRVCHLFSFHLGSIVIFLNVNVCSSFRLFCLCFFFSASCSAFSGSFSSLFTDTLIQCLVFAALSGRPFHWSLFVGVLLCFLFFCLRCFAMLLSSGFPKLMPGLETMCCNMQDACSVFVLGASLNHSTDWSLFLYLLIFKRSMGTISLVDVSFGWNLQRWMDLRVFFFLRACLHV